LSHLSFTLNRDQHTDRLNVGLDLGKKRWVMDVLDTVNGSHHRFDFAGSELALKAYQKVDELIRTGREVDVIYEAGRNGFTPARVMGQLGARVTVLPVNRLELIGVGKKAKTDRLDARNLSERDARAPGFPSVWVPSVDEECRRRMLKEKERLDKEIKRENNRILGILERWPVPPVKGHLAAAEWREKIREWREREVVPQLLPEIEVFCIEDMVAELELLEKNRARWNERIEAELEKQRQETAKEGMNCLVDILMQYRGIGREIALGVVWYVANFKRFRNGKKFASYLGLVPDPWESGTMRRQQGISKCGSTEVRRLMIELAWLWVRYQPDSPITRKWKPRLEKRGRTRRTAIVAVARQLAVAILRRLNNGVEMEGAIKNRALPVPATNPDWPLAA